MQIPRYTKGIVRERAVPTQLTVENNVFSEIAQPTQAVANVANAYKQANDKTAFNEAVISGERKKIELADMKRQERLDSPFDFAKDFEPDLKKLDDDIAKSLPSAAAKKMYLQNAAATNVNMFSKNLNWQRGRETEIYAARIEKSVEDNATLAYRAGQEGQSLDHYLKNADATVMASGGVFGREQLEKLSGAGREKATMAWLSGMMQSNLPMAKKELDSGKLDFIGADNLIKLDNEIKKIEKAALERQVKLFNDDPALLAKESGAEEYTDILDLQARVGVPSDRRSILPKQQAETISDALNNAGNADTFIQQAYGELEQIPEDLRQIALRDLKRNGLSDQAEFMMLIDPTTHKQHINALFEYSKDPDAINKQARLKIGESLTDINESVLDEVEDRLIAIAPEFPMGSIKMANMQKEMANLATYYVAQGKTKSDAIKMATEWFNEKIPVAEINERKFRVPQGENPDAVESVLESRIKQIEWNKLPAKNMVDQRTVYPVLAADEKSYYFKSFIDEPITDSSGNLVIVDIQEELLKDKEKRVNRKNEALKSFYEALGVGSDLID